MFSLTCISAIFEFCVNNMIHDSGESSFKWQQDSLRLGSLVHFDKKECWVLISLFNLSKAFDCDIFLNIPNKSD